MIYGNPNDAKNHHILCRFGNNTHPVSGRYISSQAVVCASPKALGDVVVGSIVFVEVSLNGGYDWTNSGAQFQYTERLRLQSLSPASGSIKGGTEVTIVGVGFDSSIVEQVQSGVNCHFAGSVVGATLVNDAVGTGYSIMCTTPASYYGRAAEVDVEVSFGSQQNDKSESNLIYTYADDFIVTSISP